MQREHIRPFGWGIALGAAALLALLFATGWMVTASAASDAARASAEKAMVENLAPICVVQFKADPQNAKFLEELKAQSSWKQYQFIQDHGWATMPGSDGSDSDVARACATMILEPKS